MILIPAQIFDHFSTKSSPIFGSLPASCAWRFELMALPFQQTHMKNLSPVAYSSTEKPLELLRGDSYISQGRAQINVSSDLHPSPKYHCSHSP